MVLLGFAILWQLALEKIPLTVAYMQKGILYVLILIWSAVIFDETITIQNIVGSVFIIAGVVVNAYDFK